MKRNGSGRPRPRIARVVWDEANLEYLDATKSPKQKITEPKTPYHIPPQEDGSISPIAGEEKKLLDQAAHAEEIQHALMEVASTSGSQRRSRGGWTSSEDEGDDTDDSAGVQLSNHEKSFKEQRRAHYDEYRKLKALRHNNAARLAEEEAQQVEEEAAPSQGVSHGIKDKDGHLAR